MLLTTNSEIIEFNSEFYDYFTILGGEINPVINENDRVKNLNNYAIYINPFDSRWTLHILCLGWWLSTWEFPSIHFVYIINYLITAL